MSWLSPAGLSIRRMPSMRRAPASGRCLRPTLAAARPGCGCSCAEIAERRKSISSVERQGGGEPAARRCPPPPWARAMIETSTSSSVARREPFCSPFFSRRTELSNEHRDLGALERPQLVDDALGVASSASTARNRRGQDGHRQLPQVVALHRPGRRHQLQLAGRGCPRRAGGRRAATSTPASISSAAISRGGGPCSRR